MNKTYRTLKKGGKLILHGAPLWNSHWGHHLWVHIENSRYEFNGNNPIPDWGHLYYSKNEMFKYLEKKNIPITHIEKIVEMIYDSTLVNRLKYDNIIDSIVKSEFKIIEVIGNNWKKPNEEIFKKLPSDNSNLAEIYMVCSK